MIYGKEPLIGSLVAGLSTIAPTFFVNYLTAAYVTRLHVDSPTATPKTKPNPSTTLTIETFTYFGRLQETKVKLGDLKESKYRYRWITWVRDPHTTGKRAFYIEKALMRKTPYLKAIVDLIEERSKDKESTKQSG
ncbi:1022_t:CDS:2 [Paraglomus brasilianum]|uniref:1022_t:CDS:1 n=1 Tax=Paraglomus brasilianum TaxID=144538 RepID=A0A9N8YUP8_9GLOM|nr:1022_t:CDS:2 [Paraglomus brasilianum]